MKSTNTQTTATTPNLDRITVKWFTHKISLKAEVLIVEYEGRQIECLDFTDITNDAHLVAVPSFGIAGQTDKVVYVPKGTSTKAEFREANLAKGKLEKWVNEAMRGMPWPEFVKLVMAMQKNEFTKGEDGKFTKTGNTVARYVVVHSTDADLKYMQKLCFSELAKYFKRIGLKAKKAAQKAIDSAKQKLAETK